jgi:hypothetical protein
MQLSNACRGFLYLGEGKNLGVLSQQKILPLNKVIIIIILDKIEDND